MEQTSSAAVVASGDKIGRYNVLGKLATGGMAEVFLARQEGAMGFTKNVVLKRILPQYANDEEFLHMFLNEARLAALINHPNVVSIFELGEDPVSQSLYMAMEYIEGRNLKDILKRAVNKGTQLPLRLAARLIAEAAAGLDFAHDLRDQNGQMLHLVHRDVSADNVLVSYSGLVKVVDFGIAKAALTESRTKTGQVKGKFGYMAPEMLLGHPINRRVDVWALGIVLYWLLTGKRPFRGESEGQLVNKVVNEPLPPLERAGTPVPPELQNIVKKSLEKDPRHRYQTAGQLRADLELWLSRSGEPVTNGSISELMERLFPATTDPERLAMQGMLNGEPRSSGWSNPGLFSRSRSSSEPPPSSPSLKNSENSLPDSQIMTEPKGLRRPAWMPFVAMAALIIVGGVGYFVWTEMHPIDPPVAIADPPVPPPPTEVVNEPKPTPVVVTPPPSGAGVGKPPASGSSGHVTAKPTIAKRPTANPISHPSPPPEPPPAASDPTPPPGSPPGSLLVDVRPWAIVFVDGSRQGMTPLEALKLPAGKHKVELVNDEIDAHVTSFVTIKPGETYTLRRKLDEANNE